MLTKVSTKGQMVIPAAVRELAQVATGDELDVGYSEGMIIMRKRQPLTPARVRSLLLASRRLPEMAQGDEQQVEKALTRVRRRVSR